MSRQIQVKNTVIGDGRAKICVPITGRLKKDIISQAREIVASGAEIIEWRVDYFEYIDYPSVLGLLSQISEIARDVPLIFTFRTKKEGGYREISDDDYFHLLNAAAATGNADFIDVEAMSRPAVADKMLRSLGYRKTRVIFSYHNFYSTPSFDNILSIFKSMRDRGGDICKIAVTPENKRDVDTLILASEKFARISNVPLISISMKDEGAVSRIAWKTTGSAITFASAAGQSAPGQLDISKMKEVSDNLNSLDKGTRIALVGFMGTGKTTVSRAIKYVTGFDEVDTDKFITESENKSVAKIFDKIGEEGFRDLETAALKKLAGGKGRIISCGGGIVLRDENIEIMKENCVTVLLTASAETVFERVRHSKSRPLLNGEMNARHIAGMMKERDERYKKAADITVKTDGRSVCDICIEIIDAVCRYTKKS